MPASIGKLAALLVLDNSRFGPALNKSAADVGKFRANAGMLNKSVSGLGRSFGSLAGSLVGGLSLAAAIQTGIREASEFESAVASLTGVLGDASKATAFVEQIDKFSELGVFDFQQVEGAAKTLLSLGASSQQTLSLLDEMGDISTATGADLDSLATTYGKVMQTGQVSTRTLNALTAQGVPIVDELARQYGVGKDALLEMVSKGRVGVADLDRAFLNLTADGAKFGGAMQRQADTIGGAFKQLGEQVSGALGDIAELVNLKGAAGGLAEGIKAARSGNLFDPETGRVEELRAQAMRRAQEAARIQREQAAFESRRQEALRSGGLDQLAVGIGEDGAMVIEDFLKSLDDSASSARRMNESLNETADRLAQERGLGEVMAKELRARAFEAQQIIDNAEATRKARQELESFAHSIQARVQTPLEQFQENVQRAKDAFAAGLITHRERDFAIEQARRDLEQATPALTQRIGGTAALESGSAAAFSVVQDFKRNGNQGTRPELNRLIQFAARSQQVLERIARNTAQAMEEPAVLEVRN